MENCRQNTFTAASKILITCDCGGSNGYRARLWKQEIQEFANVTGLDVYVSHLPPGTSNWNKVEHRLFCYITANWKGTPLADIDTVVNLIANTTTTKGLRVICQKDENTYEKGIKVSDKDFMEIKFVKIPPFGTWNYKF